MKNPLLYFTLSERRGILFLALALLLVWIAPFFFKARLVDQSTSQKTLVEALRKWESADSLSQGNDYDEHASSYDDDRSVGSGPFNPNTINGRQLRSLGLSDKTIRAWLGYLKKGGHFDKPADLERFRALSEEDRVRILPKLAFGQSPAGAKQSDKPASTAELRYFDPNTVDASALMAMGVPERLSRTWEKFLQSGGRFRRTEDLAKLYNMTDEELARLLPYVQIEASQSSSSSVSRQQNSSKAKVDVNTATVEDLQQLRGIGAAYSKRIIAFRDKLGGFYAVQQIAETYGLPDSVFQSIQTQLEVSAIQPSVRINSATEQDLARHPYIGKRMASILVAYRQQHGAFASLDALNAIRGINAEELVKVKPYFLID